MPAGVVGRQTNNSGVNARWFEARVQTMPATFVIADVVAGNGRGGDGAAAWFLLS